MPDGSRVAAEVTTHPSGTLTGRTTSHDASPALFVWTVVEPRNASLWPKPESSYAG